MAQVGKLAFAGLGLAAFGWAFAGLKPLPQGLLIGLPLVAMLVEFRAGDRARRGAYMVTGAIASAIGYLAAGSAGLTLADQWLRPSPERSMPIGTLLVGAALGFGLFALTVGWLLRPTALVERTRRAGLMAILVTGLISWGLDRIVFN